jgi:hypothetical protein
VNNNWTELKETGRLGDGIFQTGRGRGGMCKGPLAQYDMVLAGNALFQGHSWRQCLSFKQGNPNGDQGLRHRARRGIETAQPCEDLSAKTKDPPHLFSPQLAWLSPERLSPHGQPQPCPAPFLPLHLCAHMDPRASIKFSPSSCVACGHPGSDSKCTRRTWGKEVGFFRVHQVHRDWFCVRSSPAECGKSQ